MESTQNTQTTKRNFKIGDLVECCSSSHGNVQNNGLYVVLNIKESTYGTQNVEVKAAAWYPSEDFQLVQGAKPEQSTENAEFDMLNTPWFIRVKDKEEFEIAKEFVKSKGFFFSHGEEYQADFPLIANKRDDGGVLLHGKSSLIRTDHVGIKKEIKLHFKTEKVLDYVQYPEVQSEDSDQLEIRKIEDEMRKLADRLNAIKKN